MFKTPKIILCALLLFLKLSLSGCDGTSQKECTIISENADQKIEKPCEVVIVKYFIN